LANSKHTIYNRPGKILNAWILQNENDPKELKKCLNLHYDFQAVKYDAWMVFKLWYGCDVEIE
jgi:hypothetical protein